MMRRNRKKAERPWWILGAVAVALVILGGGGYFVSKWWEGDPPQEAPTAEKLPPPPSQPLSPSPISPPPQPPTGSSVDTWDWTDTSPKQRIPAPMGLNGRPRSPGVCKKLLQLSFPRIQKKFDVAFVPNQPQEEACLLRSVVMLSRGYRLSIPGEQGISMISAHRDRHFRIMLHVKKGDYVLIDDGSKRSIFQIFKVKKMPKEVAKVPPQDKSSGSSILYLTTCYPIVYKGLAPGRLYFTAHLVHQEASVGNKPM